MNLFYERKRKGKRKDKEKGFPKVENLQGWPPHSRGELGHGKPTPAPLEIRNHGVGALNEKRFAQRARGGARIARSQFSIPQDCVADHGESPLQGGTQGPSLAPRTRAAVPPDALAAPGTRSRRPVSGDPQLSEFSLARLPGRGVEPRASSPELRKGPKDAARAYPQPTSLSAAGCPGISCPSLRPNCTHPPASPGAPRRGPALTLAQHEPERPLRMQPRPLPPQGHRTTFPTRPRGRNVASECAGADTSSGAALAGSRWFLQWLSLVDLWLADPGVVCAETIPLLP